MFEEHDVASKDKRLRGWALPAPGAARSTAPAEALLQRVSPLAASVTARMLQNRPLSSVLVATDHARAAAALRVVYQPLVAPRHAAALRRLIEHLMDFLAQASAGATSLSGLGQRQLVQVARRLGIDKVAYSRLDSIEAPLLAGDPASSLERLAAQLPLTEATDAGLLPPDAMPWWGRHSGDCQGRVQVLRNHAATCLRCHAALTPQDWSPLSLRASLRMLALQRLGVDLFVAGGSSGYNSAIRAFQHRHGRPYMALAWRAGLDYAGPAQQASARIAADTAAGAYSLIDAMIGCAFDDPAGVFAAADAADPLQHVFDRLRTCMQSALLRDGVQYSADGPAAGPAPTPAPPPTVPTPAPAPTAAHAATQTATLPARAEKVCA
jgi:hypothetical protein